MVVAAGVRDFAAAAPGWSPAERALRDQDRVRSAGGRFFVTSRGWPTEVVVELRSPTRRHRVERPSGRPPPGRDAGHRGGRGREPAVRRGRTSWKRLPRSGRGTGSS
ncbi:hypothetical protein QJS66_12490 [Kocuria rhizophila]|nr:hypothetical protein QJS66_12490 [Kocuria rhizophila]